MPLQDLNKMILPTFSIIVPVYNTQKYITRCLESCIYQSFENIEIIVVDDCGKDQATQIAKEYAKQDKRIKIIQNPKNLGLFHTRIFGEKEARREYIIHLDSDDFIELDTRNAIYQAIYSEYDQSRFYPDICWFGSKRLYSKREKVFHPNLDKSIGHEVFKNNMMQWEIQGKAFSREIIQKSNGFLERFVLNETQLLIGEDALKSFAINLFAQKSIGLNQILYFYCDNPVSIKQHNGMPNNLILSFTFSTILMICRKQERIHIICP